MVQKGTKWKGGPWKSAWGLPITLHPSYQQILLILLVDCVPNVSISIPEHGPRCSLPTTVTGWELHQPPHWLLHCYFGSSPAHSPQNSQSDRCCYSSLGNRSTSLLYFKSINCFSLCLTQNQALHKIWPVYLSDPISNPFLPCVLCSPHWSFVCLFVSFLQTTPSCFLPPTFEYVASSPRNAPAFISMEHVTAHSSKVSLNVPCQQELCLLHPKHVHF